MSLFDLLRDREEHAEQTEMKASLTHLMAERFTPQEDITAYEIALITKLFCVLSVDGHIEEARNKIVELKLERHFTRPE